MPLDALKVHGFLPTCEEDFDKVRVESTRVITPGFNNWLLFSATVEAGLKRLGAFENL